MISFDAGGTLLAPYPSVGEIYSRVAKKYSRLISPEEINQSFFSAWKKKDMHGLISHSDEKIEKAWWKEIVKETFEPFEPFEDFDVFFHDLFEYFASPDCWKLFPETLEVLETLHQEKIRMCIISNWDSRLLTLCREFKIEHYFEFILISAVFGVSKPHPHIFKEACQKADLSCDEILHVGDSLEDDIQGAMRAGLQAVFLNRHQREIADEKGQKQAVISDLSGLL